MDDPKQIFEINYIKTALMFAGGYANDIKGTEGFVLKSRPYRECIIDVYKAFVKRGELKSLDEEMETEFDVLQIFPDASLEIRRPLCIFLYVMNFIFEKYFIA